MTCQLPDELFVIVTKDAPSIVHWNLSLGRIVSAGAAFAQQEGATYSQQRDAWLPWLPNPDYKTFVGFHTLRITGDMRAEYNAELVRMLRFNNLPSRLACLYAWGSLDEALLARERIGGRFKGAIKRCRPETLLRATRCNSALINFAQRAERLGFFNDQESVDLTWNTYWSGSGESISMERQNILNPSGPPETVDMSQEPLWEWLFDGILEVLDDVTPTK